MNRISGCVLLAGSLFLASGTSFGWGKRGHEVVSLAALDLMETPAKAFFKRHAQAMAVLANVPDNAWKQGASRTVEAPTHFFQWDRFGTSPIATTIGDMTLAQTIQKMGKPYVDENGSAVWRVSGLYQKTVAALKARDWAKVLQIAGVTAHYVGDLSQPMHATSDYDGQSIGHRGAHRYFEATLMDKVSANDLIAQAEEAAQDVRSGYDRRDPDGTNVRFLRAMAVEEAKTSLSQLDEVYAAFGAADQDDRLKAYFGPCLGNGAALLSKVWDMAVEESGVTSGFPTRAIDVPEPAFIQPGD